MICVYTDVLSPHQLPLAKELAQELPQGQFRYVYNWELHSDRTKMGWALGELPTWCVRKLDAPSTIEGADVLLTGIRDIGLLKRRADRGLQTFYMSERWFKPVTLFNLRLLDHLIRLRISGWVRMLMPSYRKMAKGFVRWIQNDPNGRVFAIGPWAKKDMLWLGVPESKIIPWGYFVAPSTKSNIRTFEHSNSLKVLWVGRMLDWKRVDTIIRAVREVKAKGEGERWSVQLTLVGDGPEKPYLQRLATKTLELSNSQTFKPSITFLPSQPIEKIRSIMRAHDVYVLSSDEGEGWGAALNEALEEGMIGIGTYEAGSSATMLPDSCLFHSGDHMRLTRLLKQCANLKAMGMLHETGIGDWSAERAARMLLDVCKKGWQNEIG